MPFPVSAQEASPPEIAPQKIIVEFVEKLGAEDFKVREEATMKLWQMGDPALEELKKAAASGDPEVVFRATKLIRDIEHFITPDTDPEIIQFVESYMRATPEGKADIMAKIFQKRGWRQVLKLYASEKEPQVLEELRDQAYSAAIIAAREKIATGNDQEAKQFLELAPRDERSLIALASFVRASGSLEQARNEAAGGPADWRVALARAAGDVREAAAAAREAGDPKLAAAMSLFSGDFLPWLDLTQQREEDPWVKSYMTVIGAKWDTERTGAANLVMAELSAYVADERDHESQLRAAGLLFLLGQRSEAEPVLAKFPMLEMVDYYSSVERYDEALTAAGLTARTPDLKSWVEKKFSTYLNPRRFENDRLENESEKAQNELLKIALLVSQLGMKSELISAFEGPLLAMAETDQDDFLTLLSQLFDEGSGSSETSTMAQIIGGKWAGNDDGRWRQLVDLAFSEDEIVKQWWEWTAELDQQATAAERFDGVLGLFGLIPDPRKAKDRWLKLAWKAFEKANPAQKAQFLKRISYVADYSRTNGISADMATAIKVRDLQSPEDRVSPLHTQVFLGLSMQGRWDEVVEIFQNMMSGGKNEALAVTLPDLHAYLAVSLRRAGREEEAAKHDLLAEKLALGFAPPSGELPAALKVANAYAFGGDMERYAKWISRHAIEASPSSERYEERFNDYSILLLEQGKWKESAALAEAMALSASHLEVNPSRGAALMNIRLKADLPHALALMQEERGRAMVMLENCHGFFPGGGQLADFFFPALRKAGLIKEHDMFFNQSWAVMEKLTTEYPTSEQILNSTAWLAGRAVRKLAEAEALSKKSLELNPDQAAYLDTFAEVQFAKRDRKAAVKWSSLAVNFAPGENMIRRQYERFSREPFPEN